MCAKPKHLLGELCGSVVLPHDSVRVADAPNVVSHSNHKQMMIGLIYLVSMRMQAAQDLFGSPLGAF